MSFRSFVRTAAVLLGLVVPTFAFAAYTTGDVNLRTGPGTGYPGHHHGACRHLCEEPRLRWRRLVPRRFGGVTGWMSAGYIAGGAPRYYAPPPPRYYYPPPPPVAYPRYYYPRAYYPRPYYYYPRPYRGGPYYNFSFSYKGH